MPLSPELAKFLATHRSRSQQIEWEDFLPRIPRLPASDTKTLSSFHRQGEWHHIEEALEKEGLGALQREVIHNIVADLGTIELENGVYHHPTVGEIRAMSDEELLVLQQAYIPMDERRIAILRALFGREVEQPVSTPCR